MYKIELDTIDPPPAIRVIVHSDNTTAQNPFTVTVIRANSVMSIALPRKQTHQRKEFQYWFTTDTLCDVNATNDQLGQPVFISVASALITSFRLRVKAVQDFNIKHGNFNTVASPSEPRFYMYTFPDYVEKVTIRITSDNDVCAKIFTRRANCPLSNRVGMVEFSDVYFYQSFTTFGGFSLTKTEMGPNFHLAVTIEPDDTICDSFTDQIENPYRVKNVTITVILVLDETIQPVIPPALYAIGFVIVIITTYFQYKWLDRMENNEPNQSEDSSSGEPIVVDKMEMFGKSHNVVSHNEYQKKKGIKESKYFNFMLFQFLTTVLLSSSILQQTADIFRTSKSSIEKMNLDNCYLNFLCSSSVFGFNCYNGMISSNSLVVVGLVNILIMFRKKIFRYNARKKLTTHGIQKLDAPKVVFLLGVFAMGIYWTLTSNCPHRRTLHFYTYTHSWTFLSAFMWIYSKRHGTFEWHHFFIMSISSMFSCLSFAEYEFNMHIMGYILKNILYIFVCLFSTGFLVFNYYYERPPGLQEHQWIRPFFKRGVVMLSDESGVYRPIKSKAVFVLICILLAVFWSIASFYPDNISVTKCIFCWEQCQVGFYIIYYIVQKIKFERRTFNFTYILTLSLIVISLTILSAFYIFIINYASPSNLLWTPAKSRTLNRECISPGIDWSDMDNYITSAIFIVFIIFMDYVDSNIKDIPKKYIFVF